MIVGPFTTAMLIGGLAALGWLLWFAGALLIALAAKQAITGDVTVAPQTLLFMASCLFVAGWVCRAASRAIAKMRDR
jgi:hypothetical protein